MGPLRRDLCLRRGRTVLQPREPDLTTRALRLLGLSGSLRAASTNTALLLAAARAAPDGVVLTLYGGLREVPPYDPDVEARGLPEPVRHLRERVAAADALVVACPEYAHGIPGAFKNALDWLVSGHEFPGKPVALFNASDRSRFGRDALAEVIRTMSGVLLPDHTVALLGRGPDEVARILAAPEAMAGLREALVAVAAAVEATQVGEQP